MADQDQTMRPQLLVVDLGSQYTLKIVKSYEGLGHRVALFDVDKAVKWVKNNPVKGIILSGGPASVNDEGAPFVPQELYEARVPMLCICYGMQFTADHFGGTVESIEGQRGYSREVIEIDPNMALFTGLDRTQRVWASHGDSVTKLPARFNAIAKNEATGGIAAMVGNPYGELIMCVLFHPEVSQTKGGKTMLKNFAKICGCEKDWKTRGIVKGIQTSTLEAIGDRHAVMGFSGGVDSSTLARMLAPKLGKRLHCIVIDVGQFREGEIDEIKRHAEAAGVSIKIVNAKKRYTKAIGKTLDAEKARKIFKKLYARIIREECVKIANRYCRGKLSRVVFIQGTLAPDLIESGATGGALIKSHHNVGLVIRGVAMLHPIGHLFKYEIRALARKLKLPKSVSERHPFPGPGLPLRLPGLPKTPENLEIVRWADARTREILEKHGWYKRISQLVVAYGFCPTVGVKGDARVYKPVVVVRAVRTIDFMTAEGVIFPAAVQMELILKLTQHREVSRVFFDSTPKPPATTEFE